MQPTMKSSELSVTARRPALCAHSGRRRGGLCCNRNERTWCSDGQAGELWIRRESARYERVVALRRQQLGRLNVGRRRSLEETEPQQPSRRLPGYLAIMRARGAIPIDATKPLHQAADDILAVLA
jgi:hypothetical protein